MPPRGEPPPAAGASEHFRYFRYDELIARDKASLDIFWLKGESLDNLPPPEVLQQEIIEHLEAALASFREVAEGLRDTPVITVLPSL